VVRKIKLKQRIKNAYNAFNAVSLDENTDILLEWLGIDKRSKNISEITYFTCLKMLSETLAKLPLKYYQDTSRGRIRAEPTKAYDVLANRPNKFMTPTTFWGAVELNRNHYGNAYVLMRKKPIRSGKYVIGEELQDLWIMPSNNVEILVDDIGVFNGKGEIYYKYTDEYSGQTYVYKSDDVMHFKTFFTYNGIVGKSVKEILEDTIDGALESQKFMNNLYRQGLTASMAMQYVGDLDPEKVEKLQQKYGKYLTGSKNAGKIVPVPIGLQLQPLNVSLVDAQFFDLKKYTALQIAGAMGIKPNQINNYEKSSYANSETQQLAFLVDTMLYILKQYEEEINYKAESFQRRMDGYLYKINEKAILRTDSKTQAEVITKYVNNGVYKPNEGRGYLDLPYDEDGDQLIVNGNYIPLSMVGKQYIKGGSDSNNE
jgi:HK97 family phage portal protein